MTQHTAKAMKNHSASKFTSKSHVKHQPTYNAFNEAQKVQETLLKSGHKNAENLVHAAGNLNHVATECNDVSAENINAFVGLGNVASRILQNLSAGIMEGYSRSLSDFIEISKESLSCRTTRDVVELQKKAVQQTCNSYLNSASKLHDLMLESCDEVLKPLSERTAVASDQIRKVMAA